MCCEIFFRDVAYNLNVKYLECILLLADKTENNDRGRSVHAQVKKVKVAHTVLIPVLGSQPAGDVSHKPRGRLPLLSARPAVTPATLKRAATNFAAW